MENRNFYNEILTEHNVHPEFKHDLPDADIVLEGVNPSCGDDIWLKLRTDGDTIVDGAFIGDGCAISQASADIMLGMVIGRKKDEALQLGQTFMRMIQARPPRRRSRAWRRRRRCAISRTCPRASSAPSSAGGR